MNIQITKPALKKILELKEQMDQPIAGLRIIADATSPFRVNYNLAFVPEGDNLEEDTVVEIEGLKVFVDPESVPYMDGVTLDFIDNPFGGNFRIDAPPPPRPKLEGPLAERLQRLVDEQINPALRLHGGWVQIVDVQEDRVFVELGGGCKGCGMVDVTLKQGVEVLIKQNIPEIKEVLDVTDHAGGTNPYYQPSK